MSLLVNFCLACHLRDSRLETRFFPSPRAFERLEIGSRVPLQTAALLRAFARRTMWSMVN